MLFLTRILTLSLALTLALSLGQLARHLHDYAAGAAVYTQAQELAGVTEEETGSSPAPEEPADEPKEEAIPDLAALQQVNPDVVGWITLPDTALSYPLLQGQDNSYYLSHAWDKTPCAAGAIFLDADAAPSRWHTRIYGHRMNDASMFGTLRRYQDPAFWAEHPEFLIYTENETLHCRIFAAYEAPITGPVFQPSPNDPQSRADFLADCLEQSVFSTGAPPSVENPVVTLCTCTGHGHGARWVVMGEVVGREGYDQGDGSCDIMTLS